MFFRALFFGITAASTAFYFFGPEEQTAPLRHQISMAIGQVSTLLGKQPTQAEAQSCADALGNVVLSRMDDPEALARLGRQQLSCDQLGVPGVAPPPVAQADPAAASGLVRSPMVQSPAPPAPNPFKPTPNR